MAVASSAGDGTAAFSPLRTKLYPYDWATPAGFDARALHARGAYPREELRVNK